MAAVPRVGELEFAWRLLGVPTIAITGTNGKTTVTALAAHLLLGAGIDAVAGGNIGTALSEIALRDPCPTWVVVEASSFQLADTRAFSPEIGVITNLSPDHLDRYPDVASYYADKGRLFRNATADSCWILNGEDDAVLALVGDAPGTRLVFRVTGPPGARAGWVDRRGPAADPEGRTRWRRAAGSGRRAWHSRGAQRRQRAGRVAGRPACRCGSERHRRGIAKLSCAAPPAGARGGAGRRPVDQRQQSDQRGFDPVALRSMQRPTVLLLGGKHKGSLTPSCFRICAARACAGWWRSGRHASWWIAILPHTCRSSRCEAHLKMPCVVPGSWRGAAM